LVILLVREKYQRGSKEVIIMTIETRELNAVIIFDLKGDLARFDADDITLHQAVKTQLEAGQRNLLLNFEKVKFMDSFGVGQLLSSYVSTQNAGGKIKLEKVPPKILLIFQVTMIITLFEIFNDEEEAIKSFS
jgi:anti-anti-sigma factor